VGQMPAHAVGKPWDAPGRADVAPPRPFSSIAAMYPVLASATAPGPLAVRSRLGPNVDGVAGRIQRSELLPSRDALRGLSNRARRTPPFVAGGCLRDGRQRWGSVHSGDEGTAGFPESGLCSHRCGPWGLWIRFSHALAPALAWTLNKVYAGKRECRPGPRAKSRLPGWGSSRTSP